ncbi:VacJ family lipoprotein [Acidithiobacillus montserratensis]|uniref:VacJ family lipoprotein n=1 Tax=Acidithiobacillus montserratensis TaxID=2729135 RepID=A0ACD5HDZ2_9PROT|nr:VacJ family lipoprotein [Acidithiobacillus montserratensis]MBN2679622.1 VacJ family lipoprotein [Acidithiobacillaceae bacterium]MBU2747491.1 VacJ family lipoprotein [Acidithiobacillus montserratensis]
MTQWRFLWSAAFAGSVLALSGCATMHGPGQEAATPSRPPLQTFNHTMFHLNMGLYDYVLEPVSTGYKAVTPGFVRTGVSNVFSNVGMPYIFINDFLQGRVQQGMEDMSRFLVNSVFGLGGLFDVADRLDLPMHDNSLGVTLGVWGVPQGPYLVLPFYGPSSLRSLPGLAMVMFTGPAYYVTSTPAQYALTGMGIINTGYVDGPKIRMVQEAVDPYQFMRNAWEQHEQYLISGGVVSKSQLLEGLSLPPAAASAGSPAASESSPQKKGKH